MLVCMKRTTLVLEDGCMDAVRELARKEGRQLSQVVNDLLIEGVRRKKQLAPGGVRSACFFYGATESQPG